MLPENETKRFHVRWKVFAFRMDQRQRHGQENIHLIWFSDWIFRTFRLAGWFMGLWILCHIHHEIWFVLFCFINTRTLRRRWPNGDSFGIYTLFFGHRPSASTISINFVLWRTKFIACGMEMELRRGNVPLIRYHLYIHILKPSQGYSESDLFGITSGQPRYSSLNYLHNYT